MPNASQLYLTALLEALRQHPQVKPEWLAAWDTGDRATHAAILQQAQEVLGTKPFKETLAKQPLQSLFSCLDTGKARLLPVYEKGGIAQPAKQPEQATEPWGKAFEQDLKHFAPSANAEQLLFLLEKHCATLASGRDEAVSLFDFAKMYAAVAVCLSQQPDAGQPFLLASGGLSGIQEYLYDIVSRKASKNLKGRSFFVQLLSDSVMAEVLDKLGLFRANVIYSSGSKFLILAPNNAATVAALKKFKAEFSRDLFYDFKTRVNLELEWAAATGLSFREIQTAREEFDSKISASKQRKFSDLLRAESFKTDESEQAKSGYEYFFEPLEISGEEERDVITNEEIFKWTNPRHLDDHDLTEGEVKFRTRQQIEIGSILKEAVAIVSGPVEFDFTGRDEYKRIEIEGTKNIHYLLEDKDLKSLDRAKLAQCTVLFFNKFESKHAVPGIVGRIFYAGNDVLVKDFAELAGNDRFKRLGFLRMDIDGLGKTFGSLFDGASHKNFPQNLPAYSALCRNLDYFMKGVVNEIWEDKNNDFKQHIQIIYSGGDDLFMVGKWDKIIAMAEAIRGAFKIWVCENETLSISGGIELVTPKFPTIKAADTAANMEDVAKDHYFEKVKANSITIFKHPLAWDSEFSEVSRLKNNLVLLADRGDLPRGFFTKIQGLFEQAEYQKKRDKTEAWRWRIAYDFAKMKERKKNSRELGDLLDDISLTILAGKPKRKVYTDEHKNAFRRFNLIRLAANWADFESRS